MFNLMILACFIQIKKGHIYISYKFVLEKYYNNLSNFGVPFIAQNDINENYLRMLLSNTKYLYAIFIFNLSLILKD